MLKKMYVKDGKNQSIGSITSGFGGGTIARDPSGKVLGRTSDTFRNTRDNQGRLISTNTADPNLLFRK